VLSLSPWLPCSPARLLACRFYLAVLSRRHTPPPPPPLPPPPALLLLRSWRRSCSKCSFPHPAPVLQPLGPPPPLLGGPQELEKILRREEGLRQQLQEAQDGIAERDAFPKQLQEEAALSASALKQAAQVGAVWYARALKQAAQVGAVWYASALKQAAQVGAVWYASALKQAAQVGAAWYASGLKPGQGPGATCCCAGTHRMPWVSGLGDFAALPRVNSVARVVQPTCRFPAACCAGHGGGTGEDAAH